MNEKPPNDYLPHLPMDQQQQFCAPLMTIRPQTTAHPPQPCMNVTIPPGTQLCIKHPVKVTSSVGTFEIWADETNPVMLTASPETPFPRNTGRNVQEPRAWSPADLSTSSNRNQSGSCRSLNQQMDVVETIVRTNNSNIQIPMSDEEWGQIYLQQEPTERQVQKPDEQQDVESNQPVAQEPNTCNAATQQVGESVQTYVEMKKSADEQQVQTEKQKIQVPMSLEESVQQPTQHKPDTERLVQKPNEQPVVESDQPVVQEPNTSDAATQQAGESVQTYAQIARFNPKPNSEVQADRPPVIIPAVTSIQYAPKQGHVQERPKVVTQTERPRQSDLGETQKQKVEPQAEPTWTVAKPSRGPYIRHVRPETVGKTAMSSKQTSIDAVKVPENLQAENQDSPADVPTESGSLATAKKKSKKPGKPTPSKAEKEAQERAASEAFEEALASAHEGNVFQKPVVDYIESHTSIRATIVKESLGADCVDTEVFEHSLLTYFVQNKSTNWQSNREEVRKFLQKNRDAIRTSKSAEDQELGQNYKLLLDKLCPVIIQDFLAIRALHQANLTQTLEKEYFKLIHNPDRTVLVLNCLTEEIRRAPRSQGQLEFDRLINIHIRRQEHIRGAENWNRVTWLNSFEKTINMQYQRERAELHRRLAIDRESLIKTYYRYWNWQQYQFNKHQSYMWMKECFYSLMSRDVTDVRNNTLLCDAHILSRNQTGVYKSLPKEELIEQSSLYGYLILSLWSA